VRSFAEPASDPRLALFANPGGEDVLVLYDESSEKNDRVQRRAYFLEPNAERIAQHKKPRFVDPQAAAAMNPLPQTHTRMWLTNVAPGHPPQPSGRKMAASFPCCAMGKQTALIHCRPTDRPTAAWCVRR
jgi:hypothetical protein